jgi:hypothetical protein
MTLRNPQSVDRDGVAIAFAAAAAAGDTAPADDQNVLLIRNGGTGLVTVTLATPRDVQGLAIQDLGVDVAAGAIAAVRLGPRNVFGDVDGVVSWTYSGVTTVDVAVIKI